MRFPFKAEAEMAKLNLPPLPGYYEGEGARDLILFKRGEESACLSSCTLEDAREYCSREDTHGDDWFMGFDTQ